MLYLVYLFCSNAFQTEIHKPNLFTLILASEISTFMIIIMCKTFFGFLFVLISSGAEDSAVFVQQFGPGSSLFAERDATP